MARRKRNGTAKVGLVRFVAQTGVLVPNVATLEEFHVKEEVVGSPGSGSRVFANKKIGDSRS